MTTISSHPIQGPRRTRLAPSPTGALHLGNAHTFLANWALARQRGWKIVLRIEDLDGPRIKPGAAEAIIDTLTWLGIDWDEGPIVQSADLDPYVQAMQALTRDGRAFPCRLSRTDIEAAASAPQEGSHELRYPNQLRPAPAHHQFDAAAEDVSWRLIVEPGATEFVDQFAGPQRIDTSQEIGDFIIWTKRRQPAYQLAVVVDDHRQGVTDVVRGDDLLHSAARQLLLYKALAYPPSTYPTYFHLPLVLGTDGKRLAKRHGDTRIETYRSGGVPVEAIVGLIAAWSGVAQTPRLMSPNEFKTAFNLTTMASQPIVFSQEQDAWLRSHSR